MRKEFESIRELLQYARENNIKTYRAEDISCPSQFAYWVMTWNEGEFRFRGEPKCLILKNI